MTVDLNNLQNEPSTIQDENSKSQKNYNWQLLRQWGNQNQVEINNVLANLKNRVSKSMGTSSNSEITDARTNADGTVFNNLKERLDNDDENLFQIEDSGNTDSSAETYRISDLTTSSTSLKYSVSSTATTDVNPRSQGLIITSLAKISTFEIA